MPMMKTWLLLGAALLLTLVAGFLLSLPRGEAAPLSAIANFDDCVAAGYPVMESYPEQCMTPDGRTFVNERQTTSNGPGEEMTFNGCAVAGCSGQLCVSAEEAENMFTTCEFRPEYACYREASCEPQADGKCGWTETAELRQCLANPPALDEGGEPQAI